MHVQKTDVEDSSRKAGSVAFVIAISVPTVTNRKMVRTIRIMSVMKMIKQQSRSSNPKANLVLIAHKPSPRSMDVIRCGAQAVTLRSVGEQVRKYQVEFTTPTTCNFNAKGVEPRALQEMFNVVDHHMSGYSTNGT